MRRPIMQHNDDDKNDDHKILGVDKDASIQDVRKAYKILARKWHPDKNNDPSASERFKEISDAYERIRGVTEQEGAQVSKQAAFTKVYDYQFFLNDQMLDGRGTLN